MSNFIMNIKQKYQTRTRADGTATKYITPRLQPKNCLHSLVSTSKSIKTNLYRSKKSKPFRTSKGSNSINLFNEIGYNQDQNPQINLGDDNAEGNLQRNNALDINI